MIQPQQNKYLENAVQTATPGQLLILLCDGAIRYSKKGIEAIKANQLQEAHQYIVRVQDIISEFVITLDQNAPIAEHLYKLYDYFLFRLIEGNTKKTVEPIEEVLGYLIDLKATWMEANKLAVASQAAAKSTQHG